MDPTFFDSRTELRDWLEEHHGTDDESWVGYYKADSDRSGISYGESVEEAICFGWIDGLIDGIDDERYKRRFTPRRPDSKWSKENKERVRAMVEAGTMTPAGLDPRAYDRDGKRRLRAGSAAFERAELPAASDVGPSALAVTWSNGGT